MSKVRRATKVSKPNQVQVEPSKYYVHSVVWSQSHIQECDSLADVARYVRELISSNGIHSVQVAIFKGSRVRVLFDGDPLIPAVQLVDGDTKLNLHDFQSAAESIDGWLFRQDTQQDSQASSNETDAGEFGAFDFSS